MNKVNKFDTKRTVKLLFETHAVRQVDMANDLGMTEGLLSRWLNSGDELDGFVYRYLRPMGWLSTHAPEVYNGIDTLVQGHINNWRTSESLVEPLNPHIFVIELNHSCSKAIEMILGNKPENEVRAALIDLETRSIKYRRSLDVELMLATSTR